MIFFGIHFEFSVNLLSARNFLTIPLQYIVFSVEWRTLARLFCQTEILTCPATHKDRKVIKKTWYIEIILHQYSKHLTIGFVK